MNSCLKKTELLYKSARETHNLYSTPHILTSSLLKFPFSAAYLFLKEMGEPSTALIDTSLLLLDLHLPKEAIQILELECDMFSTAFDNKWAQAKANELLMDYKLGEVWLKENLSITKDEPMSWLLMGHNRYISGQFAEALGAYEQHLRYQGKKAIYPYVHLDMGNCHLQLKNYKAAKEVFLKACTTCPTVSTWLGAGIAFFRMQEFKQAEIALVEGNHIDNKNQKVWAYLTLICLALERFNEAETAFQQMQKLELTNVTLLLEIADAFGKVGNYR
jgi:tetratricopeptide (TPR) repeat protein